MSTESMAGESFWQPFRRLSAALLDVLFPPICAGCRRVGSLFCSECRSKVIWLKEPICQSCGKPLVLESALCDFCRSRSPRISQIRAATLYVDPVRSILHQMKYEGFFALAGPLGELMIQAWPKWEFSFDIVVPIPLHSERKRQRGYNQADMLVKAIRRQLGWTCIPGALYRHRRTQPQVGLSFSQRKKNVEGAFAADAEKIKNKRILLVDDVCTTGSTLESAASVLLDAGAQSVSAFCLTTVSTTQDLSQV